LPLVCHNCSAPQMVVVMRSNKVQFELLRCPACGSGAVNKDGDVVPKASGLGTPKDSPPKINTCGMRFAPA
jgi:hypothetical protein